MKVTISQNGVFRIETEKPAELYTVGLIAGKFKTKAFDYPDNNRTLDLPIEKVIEELAK